MSQGVLFESERVGSGAKDGLDAFYTPDAVALALVMEEKLWGVSTLEPSVGGGAWVRALRRASASPGPIWGCDINHQAQGLRLCDRGYVADFQSLRMEGVPEQVVGNPPYNQAIQHVEKAFKLSAFRVAFLLRITFLAGQDRWDRLWNVPPGGEMAWRLRKVVVLPERPSFTGNGATDPVDYAFLIWERLAWGKPEMGWLSPEALDAARDWCLTGERPKRWTGPKVPAGNIDDPRGRCA